LRYCQNKGFDGFEDVEATAKFCEVFNDIFDLLNAHSINAPEKKKPVTKESLHNLYQRKEEFKNYILNLRGYQRRKGKHGNYSFEMKRIVYHSRNTGFIGLIVDLEAYFLLSRELLEDPFDYVVPYRWCQDLL
jgi:hypothetical protein